MQVVFLWCLEYFYYLDVFYACLLGVFSADFQSQTGFIFVFLPLVSLSYVEGKLLCI